MEFFAENPVTVMDRFQGAQQYMGKGMTGEKVFLLVLVGSLFVAFVGYMFWKSRRPRKRK